MDSPAEISVVKTAWDWWRLAASYEGYWLASRRLMGILWEFVRDSTPERLRQRYGDADYDWDYRVNTTSGAVGWRDRLLGQFHSAYQPTEPAAFHEMLNALQQSLNPDGTVLNFRDFTFVDLGSGKGRALLMASEYPFHRIIGVEFLASLHRIAQQNLREYKSNSQKCFAIESICADATTFLFPADPLVIYLFNPLPESGLRQVIVNLEHSLRAHPRAVYVLYHNPLLEHVLGESSQFRKIASAQQYSMFTNISPPTYILMK
jgi:SAM-dependent methyltransferase